MTSPITLSPCSRQLAGAFSARRRGYTLTEMVISTAVLSVVVAVLYAGMTVLLREGENNRNLMTAGASGASSASAQAAAARQAVDVIDADLKVATSIVSAPLTPAGLQLTLIVPGRYASDASETIVYQWNGPGTSLTRQINASPPASISDNVQNWNLTTISKTVAAPSAVANAIKIE